MRTLFSLLRWNSRSHDNEPTYVCPASSTKLSWKRLPSNFWADTYIANVNDSSFRAHNSDCDWPIYRRGLFILCQWVVVFSWKLASGSKRVELNSVDVVAAREWYTNKAFVVQDSLCLPNFGGYSWSRTQILPCNCYSPTTWPWKVWLRS